MLPGIARVFQGNRFVASTHLPLTPAGGKLIVPFGTDDSVTVTAEPDKVIGDSKGFLINERTTSKQRHAMSVTNNKRVAVEVRVEDVVPDSSHEDVKARSRDMRGALALWRARARARASARTREGAASSTPSARADARRRAARPRRSQWWNTHQKRAPAARWRSNTNPRRRMPRGGSCYRRAPSSSSRCYTRSPGRRANRSLASEDGSKRAERARCNDRQNGH